MGNLQPRPFTPPLLLFKKQHFLGLLQVGSEKNLRKKRYRSSIDPPKKNLNGGWFTNKNHPKQQCFSETKILPRKSRNPMTLASEPKIPGIHIFTIPETNGLPLKMDGWNTTFLLRRLIFRGEPLVSGRVIIFHTIHPPIFFWGFQQPALHFCRAHQLRKS